VLGFRLDTKIKSLFSLVVDNQEVAMRGGRRPGGGRPKGARDKKPRFATSGRTRQRTEDLVDRLVKAEALELPLDRLLRRINDPTLSEEYKDKLASVAVNFTSPRLSAVALVKRPALMSDAEIETLLGLTNEDLLRLGDGRDRWPAEVPNAEH
jgi:hypothetical protein